MHQDATWMEVGLGPGDFVFDEDPAPLPRPQFSVNVYCGQSAEWIKMPLGTEIGLGSGDIVLDGDTAPHPLKGHSPQLSANAR